MRLTLILINSNSNQIPNHSVCHLLTVRLYLSRLQFPEPGADDYEKKWSRVAWIKIDLLEFALDSHRESLMEATPLDFGDSD